jgi:hypothetical protein
MDKSKNQNPANLRFYILALRKYCVEHRNILKRVAFITLMFQLFQILYILTIRGNIAILPPIIIISLSAKEVSIICSICMFIYVIFYLMTDHVFGSEQYAKYYDLMKIGDKKTDQLLNKTLELCHKRINMIDYKIRASHVNSIDIYYKDKILTIRHGVYNELLISKIRDIVNKEEIEKNKIEDVINFRGYLIRDIKKDIKRGKNNLEKIIWYYI